MKFKLVHVNIKISVKKFGKKNYFLYLCIMECIKTKELNYYAKDQIKKANNEILKTLVNHFERQGLISNEELKKYYLDETGNYVPKISK